MRLEIERSIVTIYKDDGSTFTQQLSDGVPEFNRLVLHVIEDLCNGGSSVDVEEWALKSFPDILIPFDKLDGLGSAATKDIGDKEGNVPLINSSENIDLDNEDWENIEDGSDDIVIYGGGS